MDLKKKFAEAKQKTKEYAPWIITGASLGAAIGFAFVNEQLKNKHSSYRKEAERLFKEWHKFAETEQIIISDEAVQRIKDGDETGRFDRPGDDYYLTIQVHDKTED